MHVGNEHRGRPCFCPHCEQTFTVTDAVIVETGSDEQSPPRIFDATHGDAAADAHTPDPERETAGFESDPGERPEPAAADIAGTDGDAPGSADPWAEPGQEVPDAPAQDTCVRCGRTFRGDWDRHETPEGILCNICARQAGDVPAPWETAAMPRETVKPPTTEELRELRSLQTGTAPPPDPDKYKGLLPFLVFAGVVMLVVFLLPVEEWTGGASRAAHEREPGGEAPWFFGVVSWMLGVTLTVAGETLAVYLGMHQADKVVGKPAEDLPEAFRYALILIAINLMLLILALPLLLAGLVVLLSWLALWAFTNLEHRTIAFIFLFHVIITPLTWIARNAAMGLFALLFT